MGLLSGRCPGTSNMEITEKICPVCGSIIELFQIDTQMKCSCGFIAYNDVQSCVQWCKHARLCVGDEAFNRIRKSIYTTEGE